MKSSRRGRARPRTRNSRTPTTTPASPASTITSGASLPSCKASGQWDNTIIIFSGDNGLSLGEHGLFGKQNLYEFGGMHVPLVIAGPGIPKGRSAALVYLMDLFPTFAEFAGAKIPAGVEGKSIVPDPEASRRKVRDVLYTALPRLPARHPRRPLETHPLPAGGPDAALRSQHRPARVEQPRRPARTRREGRRVDRLAGKGNGPLRRHRRRSQVANPKPAGWSPPPAGAIKARKAAKAKKKNKAE